MFERFRLGLVTVLGVILCLYTLAAVNYNFFQTQSQRAIFVMLGMAICFLVFPVAKSLKDVRALRLVDMLLALAAVICFTYLVVQTEPFFSQFWPSGEPFTRPTSLGNRAGEETGLDIVIGLIGLGLVLEGTRRSIGWIVPLLALSFVLHSLYCRYGFDLGLPEMPEALLPHQGQSVKEIASVTFLQSLGVLGPAAGVMFRYVFLFVVFGSFLEMSGATQFIIDFAERIFGRSPGGPAKVSVLGSGLMGSLSGSAVANAVTTGSFTIPMMRNSGFQPHIAGGITAAAASGGALVPPVMGAGAYMMLEFVKREAGQPQVTFMEIARAALIPAVLYYLSIFMIVHFYSGRVGVQVKTKDVSTRKIGKFEGFVFFGALTVLIGLLFLGLSPFKAVTGALVLILLLSTLRGELKISRNARIAALVVFFAALALHQLTGFAYEDAPGWLKPFLAKSWEDGNGVFAVRPVFDSVFSSAIAGMFALLLFGLLHRSWRPEVVTAFAKSAKAGVSLVSASACVGIVIGIVQTTPMANDFGAAIKSVVETNLLLALIGIMACSIVLGMGVPSVVCYLLMATLMGSLLSGMGVDPLAAHLFIFYFGMMSMVTPPVALAAYASASIADAKIMSTAFAAFRFSLVGFTLPFMFIYRPQLLLMGEGGLMVTWNEAPGVLLAVAAAVAGIVSLAGGVTGYFFKGPVGWVGRILMFAAAIMLLAPAVPLGERDIGLFVNLVGAALLVVLVVLNSRSANVDQTTPSVNEA